MKEPEKFSSREEFLALLWSETINPSMKEHWIENAIQASEKNPNGPFGDIGAVLKRLLSLGASKRDLSLIHRMASYQAVFSTLYKLGDPGVDPNNADMLFEELLISDPSGLEARPGSAP